MRTGQRHIHTQKRTTAGGDGSREGRPRHENNAGSRVLSTGTARATATQREEDEPTRNAKIPTAVFFLFSAADLFVQRKNEGAVLRSIAFPGKGTGPQKCSEFAENQVKRVEGETPAARCAQQAHRHFVL